jgi:hypothetical protein
MANDKASVAHDNAPVDDRASVVWRQVIVRVTTDDGVAQSWACPEGDGGQLCVTAGGTLYTYSEVVRMTQD